MHLGLMIRRYGQTAFAPLAIRAGIVGANFAVLMWLAGALTLAGFGALMHLWALAVVVATGVSVGAPLVILRDGAGGHRFCVVALAQPTALALVALWVLSSIWPDQPWLAVVALGLAVNLLNATASLWRVRGNVGASMALRDAGPFVTLGVLSLVTREPTALIWQTAGTLAAICLFVILVLRPFNAAGQSARAEGQGVLWAGSVLGTALAQVDLVVAGAMLPPEVFGLYALLRRIANLIALPVSVATWVSAGPVAAALRAGDRQKLARASAAGSRIAWYPAVILAPITLTAAAGVQYWSPAAMPLAFVPVFVVLLAGALVQAYWASGFTVASLSDRPALSLQARLIAVLAYLGVATGGGPDLGPLAHALAYVGALTLGHLLLWGWLWRGFGVDTSAGVLRHWGRVA